MKQSQWTFEVHNFLFFTEVTAFLQTVATIEWF